MNAARRVVIVGAGLAGLTVASALREYGFEGAIEMHGDEAHLAYDRPPLSKGYLLGEVSRAGIDLRAPEAWDALRVEFHARSRVVSVDPAHRRAHTAEGVDIAYDDLVWAAGGRPRAYRGAGFHLDGVLTLRDVEDADALRHRLATARRAVILGGGYIGLELAAALRTRGIDVVVLEAQERLLARVTGPELSDFYLGLHRARGVDVRLGETATEFLGAGAVTGVRLASGDTVAADLVVVGIGLVPSVEPLERAGVACGNGVDTDEEGRTSEPHIWAAGDCANSIGGHLDGRRLRIESVHNATQRARRVAASLAGAAAPAEEVPWSWSNQYDVKLRSTGIAAGTDERVVRGRPEDGRFTVVYLRDGVIRAADCVGTVKDYVQARRLIEARARMDPVLVSDSSRPLLDAVALEEVLAR